HAVHDAVAESDFMTRLSAEEVDRKTAEARRFQQPVAETQLLVQDELTAIEAFFADAPDAWTVLQLKAAGHTESEIMSLTGMNKRRFEAARKRARRGIIKYVFDSEKGKK